MIGDKEENHIQITFGDEGDLPDLTDEEIVERREADEAWKARRRTTRAWFRFTR